jgi:non-ribosomal peptide synthetase component E (peptide arylation enzyme)
VSAAPRPRVRATRSSPQASQYLESGLWAGRLVDQALAEGGREHPQRLAVVDRERRVSYGELTAAVERAAAMLAGLGVRPGDVVSFQLPNWVEAAIVYHATVRLGAVSNPIIPIYRGREVEFILRQTRARVVVVPDVFRRFDHRAMIAELRPRAPDLEHVLVVGEPGDGQRSLGDALDEAGPDTMAPEVRRDAGDVALVLYTSGTEASPKGVLHSHHTLVYECQSIIDLYELAGADRVFMPSPVTHITGLLYGLTLPFMLGTSVALQDVWDVDAALELVERERATFCVGATPFLHGLVHSPRLADHDVSSLRVFGCGGADVPPALIVAAREQLGIVASRLYGSTECPTVTGTALRAPIERHAATDGRAIGAEELRVVDEDEGPLPPGARGDLQVRGPDLCLGYLDAALNERAFTADGWFRSGDLAVADAEGDVRIAGRAKDVIVRGGENLSAKEIEDLLFEHPGVDEVAVVGYPDDVLGERACAVVVARGQLDLGDLVAFLRDRRVANQKLPERLVLVETLPKTASGKVQKFRLREQLRATARPAMPA